MRIQLLHAPRDVHGRVADTLQIIAQFHRRNHLPEIRGDRLKSDEHIVAVLVHGLFERVDLLVIRNHHIAAIGVALEETRHRIIETAFGQARHHEHRVPKVDQSLIEAVKSM